jgi:hypothetical protein
MQRALEMATRDLIDEGLELMDKIGMAVPLRDGQNALKEGHR